MPQMVDQRGKIHPAPWVPFTRAGCDVGAFSVANIEFENTTSDGDVPIIVEIGASCKIIGETGLRWVI